MARFISASATNLVSMQSPPPKADLKGLEDSADTLARDTGYSSTPHAPRCRKPFPFGSIRSAKAINQSYKYLSNKAWSNTDLDKQKREHGEEKKVAEIEVSYRPESTKPTLIKPFRRTTGAEAPDCVPVLDLRRFNEPDEEMAPIELVNFIHPLVMDTQRTDISWGTPRLPPDVAQHGAQETVVESVKKKELETVSEKGSRDAEGLIVKDEEMNIGKLNTLEESRLKYVENRVMSEERGREEVCHPTQKTCPQDQAKRVVAPGQLHEKALSKRVRFSARVLTQLGRDVQRELCGFFFLADGSLTIYELRQFGQKISALPLVPRAVYKHPMGRRTGEPYEIRHIKKGATLYFDSLSLLPLPESLKKRPILGIRIIHVDEEAKLNIMRGDLKPSQHSQVQTYLCQSPSEESKRHGKLLQTLQGMLRNRLRGRGSQVLVGLGRYLKRQATPEGLVDKILLEQGMRAYHVNLTPEDFDHLWDLLQEEHFFTLPHRKHGLQEGVWLDRIISGLVGEMGEDRKAIVRKVFMKLDSTKFGSVLVSELHKYFSPLAHPDVVSNKKTAEELLHGLFGCLQPPLGLGPKQDRGRVTYADFEHYYEGVSIDVESDSEFINVLTWCWSM